MNGPAVRRSGTPTATTSSDANGKVNYFEPAVLAPPDAASAASRPQAVGLVLRHDGGLLDEAIEFPAGAKVEKTLVLIKPDNFRFPTPAPAGSSMSSPAPASTSSPSRSTA